MGLKENGVNVRLDSSGLGYRPEAGSWEHSMRISTSQGLCSKT